MCWLLTMYMCDTRRARTTTLLTHTRPDRRGRLGHTRTTVATTRRRSGASLRIRPYGFVCMRSVRRRRQLVARSWGLKTSVVSLNNGDDDAEARALAMLPRTTAKNADRCATARAQHDSPFSSLSLSPIAPLHTPPKPANLSVRHTVACCPVHSSSSSSITIIACAPLLPPW